MCHGTFSCAEIERGAARFTIVNAYTQFHWKGEAILADYDAIRHAFRAVKQTFAGKRIGYPLIGAGFARGDWKTIAAIIDEELAGEDHTLVEYEPKKKVIPVFTERDLTKLSKFLSLVLRHKPEEIGITLDEAGWVDVVVLLDAFERYGDRVSRAMLDEVVATSDKKRFAFSDDGTRIRASQGHSIEVELGYEPAVPPEYLFHGTATRFLEAVRKEGLKKMKRHHVHLSLDEKTASAVGTRHGKLAMLRVRAGEMHRAGVAFYVSANGVWLTDEVPAAHIDFPPADL